jgi:arylsulfatase A-like enzyme
MTTRRNALQALAGAAAAPGILRARRTPGDKPNLLFLWTDQQRADSMAAYGNTRYHVPVWNKLASECVVFDRCYDAQPVCTPARSCVMTGTWPHQNGCIHNNIRLRSDVKTMPELLDDSSYRTAYMGKWHLGDEVFAQRGFQEWRAIEDGIYQSYYSEGRDKNARSGYHNFLLSQGYKPDDSKHANSFTRNFATKVPVEHSKPSFLAQEAAKFILKSRNDPWMLYVNTLEPHTPFSSALNDLHTGEQAPLQKNYPGLPSSGPEPEAYKRRRAGFVRDKADFDLTKPEGWHRMHRNYAGLCSLVDQAWGRILWALEVSGQLENTILVHTSDHGEMMGSHTLMAKSVMYEEAVHVPFLLRVPFRHQKPHHIPQPVSHIDMVPTLLDLMGKKDVSGFAGQTLTSTLLGKRKPEDIFIEWNRDVDDEGGPQARTVVTPDGWKMVLHDTDACLLFDRNKDPLEMNNIYYKPEHAGTVRRLRTKIEEFQKKNNDKMPLPDMRSAPPTGG